MTTGRDIDHLVIAGRSLDGLAARYEGLGFTLTPRAYHEDRMGTSNRLAQFDGRNFLELLEVDRPDRVENPGPDGFAFGAFLKRYVAAREGLAMIVFQTEDARADIAAWQAKGLATYAPFDFERQATLPDGSAATVAFSLGFVTSPDMPDLGFFVCENRAPEHFWKPDFQRHGNGAEAIHAAILCSAEPERHGDFLGAMFGGAVHARGGGIWVEAGDGFIAVQTPDTLADTGWSENPGARATGAGMQILSAIKAGETVPADKAGGAFIQWI